MIYPANKNQNEVFISLFCFGYNYLSDSFIETIFDDFLTLEIL